MKLTSLLRLIIVIIIIIGGTIIIIIIRGPIPNPPECTVCGQIKLLGIAEVLLGIVSLVLFNKVVSRDRLNQDIRK